MIRIFKRRVQKVLPLVLMLALLTPLAQWLSKEDDSIRSARREKDYHPRLSEFQDNPSFKLVIFVILVEGLQSKMEDNFRDNDFGVDNFDAEV